MTGARLGGLGRRVWWPALVVTVLAVATAFQTLPPVGHWGDEFPTNVGDPVLLMWVNVTQVHHLLSPLQGNIFYPHDNVIAYSDTLIPYLAVFAPVFKVTGDNPIAAYNAVLFSGTLAGGIAMYALANHLVGNERAALAGAVLFTISPYRSAAVGHAQLVGVCFLILGLLFLLRFLEQRRRRDAALVGLMVGLTWLGTLYCFMMLVLSAGAVLVVWAVQHRRALDRALLKDAAFAVVVAGLLIVPTLPAYITIARSGALTRDENSLVTVRPGDFSSLPPSRLYSALGRGTLVPDAQSLYPGTLLLLGAAVGVVALVLRWRRDPAAAPGEGDDRLLRTWLLALAAAAVVCGFVMLGPHHTLPLSAPYRVLRAVVPGMQNIRDLTRFWLVLLVVLAILAARGVAFLTGRLHPGPAAAAAVLIAVLATFELAYSQPMATVADSGPSTDVNRALAALPAGPVVELPLPPNDTFDYDFTVAPRQLRSTIDGDPRVEGYSGSIPTDLVPALNAARLLPDAAALSALRAGGVRYVVLHGGPTACSGELAPAELAALSTGLQALTDQVDRVIVAGTDRIVVLRPGDASTAPPGALGRLPAPPVRAVPLCFPGALNG